MAVVDTLMVLLFPFLDFIPFGLPRYWLFREKLRIPFRYIVLIMCTVGAVNSAIFYCIYQGGGDTAAQWIEMVRYGFVLVNLSVSFLLINESFPKLMFTYMLLVEWSFFVYGNTNFIASRFFRDFSYQHPYLIYNIARVGFYLITIPFIFWFFHGIVADSLKIDDKIMWRYIWKIPLISTAFGLLYYFNGNIYTYNALSFIASRYLKILGACYVYYVALKVLETSHNRTQLEKALKHSDRILLAQKKQYDALSAHMEEVRKARHDLRQHLAVVQTYIDQDDSAGLAEYIGIYKNRLPSDTSEYFCSNSVVNAIVSYYAAQALDNGIDFMAAVSYPKDCTVSSTDITVLLGNLLENAVEACKRDPEEFMFINLQVKLRGQSTLLILVDNTCGPTVLFENGTPLSSKRTGLGIGVASVRDIAARYGGKAQFEQKDRIFYASVRLMVT